MSTHIDGSSGVAATHCYCCGKAELEKLEVGLSKKFFGKATKGYYCLPCLAEYLGTTEDDLLEKVEYFKDQGCTLFG
jgi:hypothetical protein